MILLVPLQPDKAGDQGMDSFLYLERSFLPVTPCDLVAELSPQGKEEPPNTEAKTWHI